MLSKRSLVVILVGVNLLLLGLLLFGSFSLPSVFAQMSARPGDFACVTAKVAGHSYHTLFVVDVSTGIEHRYRFTSWTGDIFTLFNVAATTMDATSSTTQIVLGVSRLPTDSASSPSFSFAIVGSSTSMHDRDPGSDDVSTVPSSFCATAVEV